jgi:16S rRNA G1207 methylase RsmC
LLIERIRALGVNMEQYFSNKPASKDINKSFEYFFEGKKFNLSSNNGVFSKNAVDFGTELMIKTFLWDNDNSAQKEVDIADAGCGIGIVGVVLGKLMPMAHITMFDINERAVLLSKENAKRNSVMNTNIFLSDLFTGVEKKDFDFVLTNPPIRAGKKIVFNMYEGAFDALKNGGALYVVIQKKQGADSSIEKLNELFGNSVVLEKSAGYKIIKSIKGSV